MGQVVDGGVSNRSRVGRVVQAAESGARRAIATSPWLYCRIARSKPGRNRHVVGRGSDLLVESFPRSGTTFLVAALAFVAPEVEVASHVHHPAHVRLALRYGVPSVVLIREPVDTCTSLAIFRGGGEPRELLEAWSDFYEALEPLAGLRFVTFADLTTDPGGTVARVLSCVRRPIAVSGELVDAEVMAEVDRLALARSGAVDPLRVSHPTPEREQLKAEVRTRFELEPDGVDRARRLYLRLSDR